MNFLTFEILKIKDVKIYLHWTWVVTMMFVAYLNPNMFLYIFYPIQIASESRLNQF